MSPLFLEFLMGRRHLECTPWGMPAYSIFGWQKPCYLMQEGYADTFQELLDSTDWRKYGYESGNPKCANCMMHSGYEASAVHYTFSLRGVFATVRAMLDSRYRDAEALRQLEAEKPAASARADRRRPRGAGEVALQGTEVAAPDSSWPTPSKRPSTIAAMSPSSSKPANGSKATSSTATPRRGQAPHHGETGRRQAGGELLRNRAARLYRPRHGGRAELGSLGPEIRRP